MLSDAGLRVGDIDVVIGGPPCQGFSMIGSRHVDDPRNRLIFDFLRVCSELETRYFVMENVPGLHTGKMERLFAKWIEEAQKLDYCIVQTLWVLNAVEFGVPQNRTRCFTVGYRNGLSAPSQPQSGMGCGGNCQLGMAPTVRDAIDDLPDPRKFMRLLTTDRVNAELGKASLYAEFLRGERRDPCNQSRIRLSDIHKLTSSKRTVHTERSRRRFKRTKPGSTEPISRFPKLNPESVAPTVRAGSKFRSSGYTAARPIHHEQDRCITVREAARLQSFPDWFEFNSTIWHGFRQVGNAVPPNMARAVALQFAETLNGTARTS